MSTKVARYGGGRVEGSSSEISRMRIVKSSFESDSMGENVILVSFIVGRTFDFDAFRGGSLVVKSFVIPLEMVSLRPNSEHGVP